MAEKRSPSGAAESDTGLTTPQREALETVCETLLPRLEPPSPNPAEAAYFGLGADDRGIPDAIAEGFPELPEHARRALIELLDELAGSDFAESSLDQRTCQFLETADRLPMGRFAAKQLKAAVFGMLAARFDERGHNPDWEALGYPGPASLPPSPSEAPKTLPLERVGGSEAHLSADVCVVGSGGGGSVIAARLAQAGRSVLVLEAGGYHTESDFRQLEMEGLAQMYLDGGVIWSEDGSLAMIAGSTLGGGTVINSMVCLRTPDYIRERWEQLGLDGIVSEDFDRYTDMVWDRLNVNSEATHFNRNTELMIAGLQATGRSHQRLDRNASLEDDPTYCGYCNAGCQQGCKRSTLHTYLADAAADGARFVVDCHVDRIRSSDGHATGVEAHVGETRLTVDAPTVVVAAGGIASPALLLRSGIGGPAVGKNLRVHPTYMVSGVYEEPVEAWSGQIQSAASMDMTRLEGGGGFLIETLTLSPAMWAGHTSFVEPRRHREELLKLPHTAAWHAVSQDHGSGHVTITRTGQPLVHWRLDDEVDRRTAGRAHAEIARLHEAAGASEIFTFHWTERRWHRGDPIDEYAESLAAAPPEDINTYSAHQMGSCRLGADPLTSVADGSGQLHDTRGIWIGDASALPTTPGVNPMISLMALAERTAERMIAAG